MLFLTQARSVLRTRLLLLVVLILAACGSANEAGRTPTIQSVEPSPTMLVETLPVSTPTAAVQETPAPTQQPSLAPGQFTNPVFDHDFPDPDVIQVGDLYYAYATNSEEVHVQAARSDDLVTWEFLGDALPSLPGWAVQDFGWTWAPDVSVPANGQGYILYYTTRFAIEKGGVQCIGIATSDVPEGPFKPYGDKPLVCPVEQGGAIDAATFIDDDGKAYLLWKNDGNSMGGITWIHIQPVSQDGLTLQGEPTQLIKADKAWEGVLVEGPTMWKQDGRYYLFYSANDYASPRYAAGYAVAENILGPYTKADGAFLTSNLRAGIVGPGGQDITTDEQGQTWMLFHGWDAVGFRDLNLVRLDWEGDQPVLGPLSRDPLPGPVDEAE